ncbi:MAG: redoxin domain-containing protein, partial [Chloroflexota bacterium]
EMMNIPEATQKKSVPVWVQVLVFGLLMGLMVLVGIILFRRQQGTVQPNDQVRNFTLPLFSGYEYQGQSEVKLSDLRGKVVVLNFWASWCKPCEQEAAEMQETWEYYEPTGQVVFLGADYVDTEPEARVYLKKYGITYPNGPDMGTEISQMFRIKGVPETYFIDQEGVVQYVQVGPFSSADQIKSIIEGLLE